MRVADLPLDPRIAEILRADGIDELYPPQAEAIGPALQGLDIDVERRRLYCACDAGVLADASRPLVLYGAAGDAILRVAKTSDGRVRITY